MRSGQGRDHRAGQSPTRRHACVADPSRVDRGRPGLEPRNCALRAGLVSAPGSRSSLRTPMPSPPLHSGDVTASPRELPLPLRCPPLGRRRQNQRDDHTWRVGFTRKAGGNREMLPDRNHARLLGHQGQAQRMPVASDETVPAIPKGIALSRENPRRLPPPGFRVLAQNGMSSSWKELPFWFWVWLARLRKSTVSAMISQP